MSQLDAIQEQIRSSRITASPELRARVQELAAAEPPARAPRRGLRLPSRRWTLVLVPAAVAIAVAGAVAIGLATSGKGGKSAAHRAEVLQSASGPVQARGDMAAPAPKATTSGGAAGSGSLPATAGRAQLYESELTLKVKSLSDATKRALRLTRGFNGYVRSVEYGSGAERGSAYLLLRIPIGSVQAAIVRFSGLGEILDQHVSIQDVQPQLDRRFREMQSSRDAIAKLQARLESPSLSADERRALENELVAARRQLVVLQRAQAQLRKQTSFATVSLDLRSAVKAVAVPHEPGRIGRALDRAGSILVDEAKVALYVLIVGAPFLVLAALGFVALHARRRRNESRLLATS